MLTVPEAARIAGKNPETIRRWIRSGRLSARRFGAQHVIDADELDEVVNGVRSVGVPDWLTHTPDGRPIADPLPVIRELRDVR